MKSESEFESYIDEAINNIRQDRAMASKLLTDLVQFMSKQTDHETLGLTASKYLETLQRSNEQLVKITAILNKRQAGAMELDENDRQELFDIIQGEK